MPERLFAILLLVGVLTACSPGTQYPSDVKQQLEVLDQTIAGRARYETIKSQYITRIKAKITPGCTDMQRYGIYDNLFDEYYQYNLDSATFYARSKLEVARRIGSPALTFDAILDIADRYVLSGMYVEAQEFLSQIDSLQLPYELLPRYYHVYHAFYDGMATNAGDPLLRTEYRRLKGIYQKLLYDKLGKDDIARLYLQTDMLCDEGKAAEALEHLMIRYETDQTTLHERAILAYLIATVHQQTGNNMEAIRYYAESAIHDLKTPVHEHRSLYELASLLYENGDLERAYRYVTCAGNDAMTVNALNNIHSINRVLPIISESYNTQMTRKRIQLNRALWSVSILTLLFVGVALIAIRDKRRVSAAEHRTREINKELSRVNARLQKYIALLQESNNIKESYLGRYLDLCSEYIGRIETYRSQLLRIAREGGMAEVQKVLRSTAFIESELNEFYTKFDATFLHLFPDFVSQFNELLQPNKRIENIPGGMLLTTELRIFALIRLGIDDSVKIAGFLRRSVSTVYNYRVKMRNAALVRREEFEKQVMRIGRLS
ncbi:DUF6377 domain-containing protein [Alistipes sp.]|uniref:DUF6377 domain-containing protein n=1 Tax=Alistipes sp. TaxID=1872444 RepID=UPI003A8553C7